MDLSERTARGAQLLQQMLGPDEAERMRAVWKQMCPDFEGYVLEFVAGGIWSRPGLDLRTRSLVTMAVLTATGRPLALELNIRLALNNGASRQEVIETLLQVAPYAGFPACWEGLATAQRVFHEADANKA